AEKRNWERSASDLKSKISKMQMSAEANVTYFTILPGTTPGEKFMAVEEYAYPSVKCHTQILGDQK
ncbi:hypothetical protein P7K49_035887, partial [Saguinus oedipus]